MIAKKISNTADDKKEENPQVANDTSTSRTMRMTRYNLCVKKYLNNTIPKYKHTTISGLQDKSRT